MLKSKASKVGSLLASHWANDGYTVLLAPLLAVLAVEFSLTTLQTATIISMYTIASAGSQMPLAFLADYKSWAKQILAAGLFLSALALGGYAISSSYALLLLFSFLGGVGFSGYHPISMNLMTQLFSERKGFSLGIHTVSGSIGSSMVPVIIGLFGNNWRLGSQILAVPAVISGFWIILAFDNTSAPGKKGKYGLSMIKETLGNPLLLLNAAFGGIVQIAYWGSITFIPLFFARHYGWSVTAIAALLGAFHFSAIVSQPLFGYLSDILDRTRLLFLLGMIIGVFCVLIFLVDHAVWAALFTIVIGASVLALRPLVNAKAADIAGPETRSMAIGLNFTFTTGLGALAPLLGGYLEEAYSYQVVFLVYGLIAFLGLGVLALLARREKLAVKTA